MIKLAEDTITKEELADLCQWIAEGNQLTKGPITLRFENDFANWIGSKFALFVNSGSSANLVIAYALKLSGRLKNNRVLIPAVSWVTTVSPLMQLGFDVRLVDCSQDDLGIDCDALEQHIAEFDPGLLVAVDVLGHANNYDRIRGLAEQNEILLVEDACEALGSELNGIKLGRFGLAGSFSFYYGHHISTIEGGMVVTDDEDLYHIMLSLRSHGWSRDLPEPVRKSWKQSSGVNDFRNLYTFYFPGFNLRSSDLQAFLGCRQLESLNSIVKTRGRLFDKYKSKLPDFYSQTSRTDKLSSFAYGTFVTNPDDVHKKLRDQGIETRPLICGNIAEHPFWINYAGPQSTPNASIVHRYGIYLPLHHNLTVETVNFVAEQFKSSAQPFHF